jgi:hypothetical protein
VRGDYPRSRVAEITWQCGVDFGVTAVTFAGWFRQMNMRPPKRKWALVLLPAPTAPEVGSPVPCGISFRFRASGSAAIPKDRHLTKLLSVSAGVSLCGEASTRTWHKFSCSNLHFQSLRLAPPIPSGPVSGSSAAVRSLSRRSAFSWRHRCLTS